MMFGHPSQHSHMMSGVQAALKSSKTPKHLRPHLEKRMAKLNPKAGYNPKTAAKAQNTPKPIKQGAGGLAAQSQIAAPPMPFQNAQRCGEPGCAERPTEGRRHRQVEEHGQHQGQAERASMAGKWVIAKAGDYWRVSLGHRAWFYLNWNDAIRDIFTLGYPTNCLR
jgi:hypothetical protein